MSPFEAIKDIATNGKQDIESFYVNSSADMIFVLQERYEFLQKHVKYLKKLLKEPEVSRFDTIKKEVFSADH